MNKSFLIFIGAGVILAIALILPKQREATLLFVGDMNFDRYIRQVMERNGEDFVFSCIADTLKKADLVVGNLEGPITNNSSISLGTEAGTPDNFVFTFPSTTANLLKRHNIKLVNIGNNHYDDFGKTGMLSTKEHLKKEGINYFGGVLGDEPIYRTEMGGTKISFVSYNQFGGQSASGVAKKIEEETKAGQMVVVYTHWGDEYLPANTNIKNIARLFAKSGAKIILGSHPHIILPSESLNSAHDKKTIVYYSLGNFIFDQYWNQEVSTGLLLELKIKRGEFEIIEHKVVMKKDGRTCPSDS